MTEHTEYDVVVVGAGPAGSSAAKALAEKGAKVIMLERRQAIGVPLKCTGMIHATPFTEAIMAAIPERIILRRPRYWRFYTPSGSLLQEAPRPSHIECVVERDEFDRELARQAIKAGAALILNINAESLLKENGRIKGVATNSRTMPRVLGKIVIAAGGYRSRQMGITKQEEMHTPGEGQYAGVLLDLTGVRDSDPEAYETIFGGSDARRNWTTLWPRGGDRYMIALGKLEQFEQLKNGKHLLARKLRDAYPVRIYGYVYGLMAGQPLPNGMVRDGLILAGDAAGYNGIIHAIVSGRWAGDVAAEAIHAGDISAERLSAYEKICKAKLPHVGLMASIFKGKVDTMKRLLELTSDEAIEREVIEMARRGELLDGEQETLRL